MFKVMSKQCNQCLFGSNKVVSNERQKEIIKDTINNGSYFECHKATIAGTTHCCHEFYKRLGSYSQVVRIAERLNSVEFSEPGNIND